MDYARAKATAARLLSGNGQVVTLSQPGTAGTYNPATGLIEGGSTVTQTGWGVVFEYSTFIRSGSRAEAGSLIQSGDKQLLLSPLNSTGGDLTMPAPGAIATLADGTAYTVTSVAPLAPAETRVYFECNIRGAP
jgi:hypothetical protein